MWQQGEYNNHQFHEYFAKNGIQFCFYFSRTSQQNGKSKSMFCIINNIICTLFFQANLPLHIGLKLFTWKTTSSLSYPLPRLTTKYHSFSSLKITPHIINFEYFVIYAFHTSNILKNNLLNPLLVYSLDIWLNIMVIVALT